MTIPRNTAGIHHHQAAPWTATPAPLPEHVTNPTPQGRIERFLELSREAGELIDGLLRTHGKPDMVSDARALADRLHAGHMTPTPIIVTTLRDLCLVVEAAVDDAEQQRIRAEAAEADLGAVDQALAELRDQISRQ